MSDPRSMSVKLIVIYDRLFTGYGPQYWWPGDSKFDVDRKARLRQRIMDLYNSVSPESLKQAYTVVKEAAVEESGEDLKLELKRDKKATKKEEVQENLIWD